tara:strand:- start:669 stop:782 length:114 start_codon:yes stop_codon:yes gene_type:complete
MKKKIKNKIINEALKEKWMNLFIVSILIVKIWLSYGT